MPLGRIRPLPAEARGAGACRLRLRTADPEPGPVTAHDRYPNYGSVQLGELNHQLCLAHVVSDLAGAAELHPTTPGPSVSPTSCGNCSTAPARPARGESSLPERTKSLGVRGLRAAVRVGLAATARLDDVHLVR